MKTLSEWFLVSFDDEAIHLHASPYSEKAWYVRIEWENIIRICFKAGDFLDSDEIYIFTNERPESDLIPIDAGGGSDLWNEIIKRNLFDAELAIKAAFAEGEVFCTPED